MNDDKIRYERYAEKINQMLQSDEFYAKFTKKLHAAKPTIKLNTKFRSKVFDVDWVDKIEETLPNLDIIVRNPRKFIVIEEDIVDISLARAISTESVKHLAQHTNMIASVDKDGNVTPNKILNTTKEESYEIYENRFIYTLIKNVNNFVTRRMDSIKASYVNDNVLELNVDTSLFTGKTRVFYKLDLIASMPIDEVKELNKEDLSIVERIAKMQRILADFMSSPFAKQMVSSAPVRPPITRTNVILKNADFKKALLLWQFIESYTKMGFNVENKVTPVALDDKLTYGVTDMICIGTMLMEGLVEGEVADAGYYKEDSVEKQDIIDEVAPDSDKKSDEQKAEEEKQKEEKKAEDEDKTKEEQKKIEQEVNESTDISDKDKEEKEKDEEIESEGELSEIRNMFQRTDDASNLSKAEVARINKAIDRVLMQFRANKYEKNSEEVFNKIDDKQIERIQALKQLEKEIVKLHHSIDMRKVIAEKERSAYERAIEKESATLLDLESRVAEERKLLELEDIDVDEEAKILSEGLSDDVDDIDIEVPYVAGEKQDNEMTESDKKADEVTESDKKADEVTESDKKADETAESDKKADEMTESDKKADEMTESDKKADETAETAEAGTTTADKQEAEIVESIARANEALKGAIEQVDTKVVEPTKVDKAVDTKVVEPTKVDKAVDTKVVEPTKVDKVVDTKVVESTKVDKAVDTKVVEPTKVDKAVDTKVVEPTKVDKVVDKKVVKSTKSDKK